MTPIMQAAAEGYSEDDILKFITRLIPQIAPRVAKAAGAGYSKGQILKYVNSMFEDQSFPEGMTPNQIHGAHTERLNKQAKRLLGTAATVAGTAALVGKLPKLVQTLMPNIGPKPMSNAPTSAPSVGGANVSQPSTQTPLSATPEGQPDVQQPAQQIKPPTEASYQKSPAPPTFKSADILKEMGLEPKINNLLKAGNSPENIGTILNQTLLPGQKKWLEAQIKEGKAAPLPELVNEYLKQKPLEMPKAPEKGSVVAGPNGVVGEIKSTRNGQALVESGGKLHKVAEEDLITSPIAEKDLADLHEDLIKGIEKETGEDVSRMVNYVGYDPHANRLSFLPHSGALYIYDDISPEDVKLLTNILSTRKTSGDNFIGAWKKGTKSPIGAAMSALIQKLQKEAGGKGKEYSGKYETVYSALEPAIQAAKKKKKKK